MSYKIEDLDVKDDSEEEQARSRIIFEDLKDKAVKKEKISEHEKDFFCMGVRLSLLDDGRIEDYDCCSNYKFKITYLTYFHDLTGFGAYSKPRGTALYQPGKKEIGRDIEYLRTMSIGWLREVETTNHSEQTLQLISAETRSDLKEIEKKKGRILFARDREKYTLDRRKVLLQSRFIYCRTLQIFEMYGEEDFILRLNGQEIEITEASIIHILNRHFSKITKPHSQKSFHIEDFDPKILNKQLKTIFETIENSGVYVGQPIDKIAFKYDKIDYLVWTKKRIKQVRGKGNIEFIRLETFYPVTDAEELNGLKENYELMIIDDSLSVYIKI
jgi:hypothetical protein